MTTTTYGAWTYPHARPSPRRGTNLAWWGWGLCGLAILVWGAGMAVGFQPAISVLVAAGFALAIFGFVNPAVGLLGVGMLCTLDAVARMLVLSGGILRWNTLNYFLLVVIGLNALRLVQFRSGPLRVLLAFLVILCFGLIYSMEVMEGIQHVLGIVSLLGLLVFFMRGTRQPETWVWIGMVNGVVAGVGGFLFFLQKSSLPEINPNAASYFPLTGLFSICLGFPFARKKTWQQVALLGLAMACTGWVFLTGSRGAILITVCCWLFLFRMTRGGLVKFMFAGLAAVMALVISTHFGEMREFAMSRVQKLFDNEKSLVSRTSGRSDLVQVGWAIFLENPLGVGTANFKWHYSRMSDRKHVSFKAGREVAAHAGWIKTLAENGIIGVFLFAAFVGSFAASGWAKREHGLLPIGLFVTVALGVAFISTEFQGKGLWFLAAGTMVLLARGYGEREKSKTENGRWKLEKGK